jgi:hypothetical protein
VSRKKSAPAKKAAPIKLRWIEQVIEHEWPEKPARLAIVGVAAVLQKYGDPGGGGICPARGTIAATLRIKPQTLDDVLELMIGAGMLAKTGRTRYGTMIYRLCLSGHTSSIDAVPDAVPHAVARETHNPQPSTDKGEGGGDTPGADAPAARVAGLNTGDTETVEPAVLIEGDRADDLIIDFIAAFQAAFAKRERGKTTSMQHLEPSHGKLRTAIITKLDAGWPRDHLIDRIINTLPDDRKIDTLSGLVTYRLSQLPDAPDATARKIIEKAKVDAEAKRKKAEAKRKQAEADAEAERARRERDAARQAKRELDRKTKRREDAIAAYRVALEPCTNITDIDAKVASLIAELDAGADTQPDPVAARLSDWWIKEITARTSAVQTIVNRYYDARFDLTMAFSYFGIDDAEREANEVRILSEVGLNHFTASRLENMDKAVAAMRGHLETRWGDAIRATGKDIKTLAHEKVDAGRW